MILWVKFSIHGGELNPNGIKVTIQPGLFLSIKWEKQSKLSSIYRINGRYILKTVEKRPLIWRNLSDFRIKVSFGSRASALCIS